MNNLHPAQIALFSEGYELANQIKVDGLSTASAGSGVHLLFGSVPSTQSLNIKFGRAFETWFETAVKLGDNNFVIMPAGVWSEINKDLDLIFRDDVKKVIYYLELKLNINLDTEKIVSTYEKVKHITRYLEQKYPNYKIDSAVLTWGTFNLEDLTAQSKLKKAKEYNVNVVDPSTFFQIVGMPMSKNAYETYFRNLGKLFKGEN